MWQADVDLLWHLMWQASTVCEKGGKWAVEDARPFLLLITFLFDVSRRDLFDIFRHYLFDNFPLPYHHVFDRSQLFSPRSNMYDAPLCLCICPPPPPLNSYTCIYT